jgi:hypothetical protein
MVTTRRNTRQKGKDKMRLSFGQTARVLVGAGALAAGLALAPLSSHSAGAFHGVCFDDPIIQLSNGYKVTLTSTTQTDASNVQSIQYLLYVPSGVTAKSITYQGNHSGPLAHVTVYASTASHVYNADTFVKSSVSAAVTAVEQVTNGQGSSSSMQASGQTNQHLLTSVTK